MAINNKDKTVQKFYTNILETGSSRSSRFYQDDPTVIGFNVLFFFSDTPGFPGATLSPLFNEDPTRDSAINYLESIDEPDRAEQLREFKSRLMDLVREYPYYFQSVSGVESTMAAPTQNPNRAEEMSLTFELLESIDLRVSTLINLYRDAVYDYKYMRYRVPTNLLHFSMTILTSEIRNIRSFVGNVFGDGTPKLELLDNNLFIHKYHYGRCTFVFDESNPWLQSLDNKGGDEAANSFSVKPGFVKEAHNLKFHELFGGNSGYNSRTSEPTSISPNIPSRTDSSETSLPKADGRSNDFIGTIKNRAEGIANITKSFVEREAEFLRTKVDLKTLGNRLINEGFDIIENRIKDIALGNVFSDYNRFRNADVYESAKDFVESEIIGKGSPKQQSPSFRNTIPLNLSDGSSPDPGSLGDKLDFDKPTFPEVDPMGSLDAIERSVNASDLGDIIDEQKSDVADDLGSTPPIDKSVNGLGSKEIDLNIAPLDAKLLGQVADIEKTPFNLSDAALGSIKGFNEAPLSSLLNNILAGSLGSIIGN